MRTPLLAAVLAAPLVLTPIAAAQEQSGGRTVVASGVGQVPVGKPAAKTEQAAQAAVDAADRAAEAKAVQTAKTRAASYAAAAGLTLGQLLTVDEGEYGIFALFADDFDDDDEGAPYCRRRVIRETRRRVIRRRTCEVPERRIALARVTYAVSG